MTIRIMLVDDHRMFREALRTPIDARSDMQVVAEAGTGCEALEGVVTSQPDVVIVDIALPDTSGIELTRCLLSRNPSLLIVALSGYADGIFVNSMLKAGARAYVVKSAGTDELLRAIHSVVSGQVFLSPEITSIALGYGKATGELNAENGLTVREQEVLKLVAGGMRSVEIAKVLHIAVDTVKAHRRNLKRKTGISSTAELTRYAIKEGIAELPENCSRLIGQDVHEDVRSTAESHAMGILGGITVK